MGPRVMLGGLLGKELPDCLGYMQVAEEPQTPSKQKLQSADFDPPPAPRKAGKWHRQLSPTAPVRRLDFDCQSPTTAALQPDLHSFPRQPG